MAEGYQSPQEQRASRGSTILWLALLVLGAMALRSVFGAESGFDTDSGRALFTGNDPYYHWRTVTHVMQTGQNLNYDTSINYPEGNWNPNPPFWTWTTAPVAVVLQHAGVQDPAGIALNVMVAFWGGLAVLPVFMIARDLWGRRAGLWAGFFMAVSAPHITRSVWGYGDHDAISMFFILLGVAFLVRGLRGLETRTYIEKWNRGALVARGLRAAATANRNTLVYAALAGASIAACAVAWKGYPYALAILAVAAFVQLVVDHLRNRDATVPWLAYLIAIGVAAVLPWILYYEAIPAHFATTVLPSLYVLAAVAVAGLLLVPTRDLPSIVVFPALLAVAVVALVALLFALPNVAYTIFSGLGYFSQSKLYSTIAEAQRPSIGEVAANLGFFTFLFAFWAFFHTLRRSYRGQSSFILVASWTTVSIFLMFAASRFIMNAAPAFCVMLGYVMVKVIDFARTGEVRKRFRARHGQNVVARTAKSLSWRPVAIVLLAVLLLVVPNLWIGADAGMGQDFEANHGMVDYRRDPMTGAQLHTNHFGAFGINQELGPQGQQHGWLLTMQYLATRDRNVSLEQRPAFIGWWDYGHWATGIGEHPTVADPFQSHFEISGRFLAADSEAEAMDWLSLLLLTGDWKTHGGHYSQPVQDLLDRPAAGGIQYQNLKANQPGYVYDPQMKVLRGNVTDAASIQLYDELATATGKQVGYFGVDDRMGPFPTDQAASQQSGIIYAPVFLANKNPDEYVNTYYTEAGGNQQFIAKSYGGGNATSGSFRLDHEHFYDAQDATKEYVIYNGRLYPLGHTPLKDPAATGIQLSGQPYFVPTAKYAGTMFARGFGGTAADMAGAGQGLSHWRVVQQSVYGSFSTRDPQSGQQRTTAERHTALLEYYKGVHASGTVVDSEGAPVAGAYVTFVDANGAQHARGTTNATGGFAVVAPFAVDNDMRLAVVGSDGAILKADNATRFQYSREQAASGFADSGIVVTIQRGNLAGTVYVDRDHSGSFNANNDTVLAGASVTAVGTSSSTATTGPDGKYNVTDVQPGTYSVTVHLAGYTNGTATGHVPSGSTGYADVALAVAPVPLRVTLRDFNGTALDGIPMSILLNGTKVSAVTTDAHGVASTSLAPAHYTLQVNYTEAATQTVYHAIKEVDLPFGSPLVDVVMDRSA